MAMETETVLDRRHLRRRLALWRILALVGGLIALGLLIQPAGDGAGWTEGRQIARVSIEGLITEDRDQLRLLKRIAKSNHVAGVIVFINSPGGTTSGGEALFEAISELSKAKPVVAQFGTIATSAAYIAGLATDQIVARGNTITGSVGVIFQWAEVSQLLDKLGIKMNEIKSGPLKANPSPFQPLDEAGKAVAEEMVAESKRWFVGLVASRRGVDTAAIAGLEQGRVFSGREALAYRLVDRIGGEAEAVKYLEEKRNLPKDLNIVDWKPKRESDWSIVHMLTGAITKFIGAGAQEWHLAGGDQVLARLRLDGLVSLWQGSER
jgi:protease-4